MSHLHRPQCFLMQWAGLSAQVRGREGGLCFTVWLSWTALARGFQKLPDGPLLRGKPGSFQSGQAPAPRTSAASPTHPVRTLGFCLHLNIWLSLLQSPAGRKWAREASGDTPGCVSLWGCFLPVWEVAPGVP